MATDAPDPDAPDDDEDAPTSKSPPRASDVDEAMRLLTWARQRGFAMPQVRIGSVTLSVKDLRPKWGKAPTPTADDDIWAEHGADPDASERD